MDLPQSTTVAVIGAGMAGLRAAADLVQAGVDVTVLEAQDRIGGRVQTETDPTTGVIERGAQALNTDMEHVMAEVDRLGLHLSPFRQIGQTRYDGIDERTAVQALTILNDVFERAYNEDAALLDLAADPRTTLSAAIPPTLRGDDPASRLIVSNIHELWSRPAHTIQMSHAFDISNRYWSDRGDWEFQIVEGFGAIAENSARSLGANLFLNTPAKVQEAASDAVVVTTPKGNLTARAAIIAVPPPVANTLLPDAHWASEALQAYASGDMIKVRLVYDRAFWREAGLSGGAISADLSGFACADTTLGGDGPPNLTIFVGGPTARAMAQLDADARWRQLRAPLERLFGPDAGRPEIVSERVWVDDPWSGGGYNAHVKPGVIMKPDATLQQVKDGVTFAGAEIAQRFPGYVDGALHSGSEAAKRVATLLD